MKLYRQLGTSLGVIFVLILAGKMALPLVFSNNSLWLTTITLCVFLGVALFTYGQYAGESKGIKNNNVWFDGVSARGVLGWTMAILLTAFYVMLYWFPEYLGKATDQSGNWGIIALFDPLSYFFKGKPASEWFMYGTLYTIFILSLGIKFIVKYRHNRYQLVRTVVVMVSQLFLAYLIPEILAGLNYNDAVDAQGTYAGWYDTDIKNVWPLDYDFFNDWHLDAMQADAYQPLGMTYLFWGLLLFLVVTPLLTYFLGKRWYCSWICGCGGLAETAGDSFRQLSSKSTTSWKIERWMIHTVMVLVFIMTLVTLYGYFFEVYDVFGLSIYHWFQKPYGFLIGAAFSGVVGVGFYPVMGNRVWCRFGCPMAGYMGIIQRFKSKFRITVNGGQCISCGNCSTYCEQGIDVRSYAQRGQNVVRASCVGCGVCAAVCPRGVLKLENGPEEGRIKQNTVLIGADLDYLDK